MPTVTASLVDRMYNRPILSIKGTVDINTNFDGDFQFQFQCIIDRDEYLHTQI